MSSGDGGTAWCAWASMPACKENPARPEPGGVLFSDAT
jgi:hypothetical protein